MGGFVYVMTNPSLAGNPVKIGMSDRDPTEYRVDELSTTGLPAKFIVEWFAFVNDPRTVEREAHTFLESSRVSKSREFFSIDAPTAIEKVRLIAGSRLLFERTLTETGVIMGNNDSSRMRFECFSQSATQSVCTDIRGVISLFTGSQEYGRFCIIATEKPDPLFYVQFKYHDDGKEYIAEFTGPNYLSAPDPIKENLWQIMVEQYSFLAPDAADPNFHKVIQPANFLDQASALAHGCLSSAFGAYGIFERETRLTYEIAS